MCCVTISCMFWQSLAMQDNMLAFLRNGMDCIKHGIASQQYLIITQVVLSENTLLRRDCRPSHCAIVNFLCSCLFGPPVCMRLMISCTRNFETKHEWWNPPHLDAPQQSDHSPCPSSFHYNNLQLRMLSSSWIWVQYAHSHYIVPVRTDWECSSSFSCWQQLIVFPSKQEWVHVRWWLARLWYFRILAAKKARRICFMKQL